MLTSDEYLMLFWIFMTTICLDVLINLNTGYYENGVLITNKSDIINNYVRKYFILDFFTLIVPFLLPNIIPKQDDFENYI